MGEYAPFNTLLGKVFTKIERTNDTLTFFNDEETFTLCHVQNCCESVWLEDVCGDLEDLLNSPILQAEEAISHTDPNPDTPEWDKDANCLWTFYKLATIKGYVTLRWYGTSNGYYAVDVEMFYERIK